MRPDFVRCIGEGDRSLALPAEKIAHVIRPTKTGADTHGVRTLCGLGRKHRVWRVNVYGARDNVTATGWAICADCARVVSANLYRYVDRIAVVQIA